MLVCKKLQVMKTPVRLKQEVINIFLQKGSIKDPDVSFLAVERIREILGGTDERCLPPTLIVGDEET